jgi:phage shock protein A
MELARNVMLTTVSAMLIGLAACATTRNPLVDSADTLNHNAQALAQQSDAMTPVLEQDAHQLAQSTLEYRSVVGLNGTDIASARTAFESVSRNYQKVKDDIAQVNTPNARADLRPVTEAYENVERMLQSAS